MSKKHVQDAISKALSPEEFEAILPTVKTERRFDPVHHPRHYNNHPSGVECIAITRHFNYNLGTVIAYLWRADHKGEPIQDLEKALFHLQDEINRRKAEHATRLDAAPNTKDD